MLDTHAGAFVIIKPPGQGNIKPPGQGNIKPPGQDHGISRKEMNALCHPMSVS